MEPYSRRCTHLQLIEIHNSTVYIFHLLHQAKEKMLWAGPEMRKTESIKIICCVFVLCLCLCWFVVQKVGIRQNKAIVFAQVLYMRAEIDI